MAEFTPINTQAELDAILGPRLQRERENAVKPYADYQQIKDSLEAANKTLGEKDATIADLNNQLKGTRTDLAKTRTALAKGLPLEVVNSLRGETEEELGKSADALALLSPKPKNEPEPARNPDPVNGTGREGARAAGYAALLSGLNLGETD